MKLYFCILSPIGQDENMASKIPYQYQKQYINQ